MSTVSTQAHAVLTAMAATSPSADVETNGATTVGTYAVASTPKAPATVPPAVALRMAAANTRLSPNMNGYAASTKVPNPKFTYAPDAAIGRSPLSRGAIRLASMMPNETMTSPTMSMPPKKLCPFSDISTSTSGSTTEW